MQLPQLAVNCIIVSVVFPLLALAAIVLRFVARKSRGVPLGWNDWTIVIALILGIGNAASAIFSAANGGLGAPEGALDQHVEIQLFQTLLASLIVRTAALAFIKTSILLLYKQIFVTQSFQRTANVFLGLVWAWGLTYIIGFLCVSTPLSVFWDDYHQITNYSLPVFTLTCVSTDLVLDVLILCLPVPLVLRLNMQRKQKWQLIGIFWLGIFCVVASACCIYYVRAENTLTGFTDPYYYWLVAQSAIWGNIEVGASIVAACLPTIGPLVNKWSASKLSRSVKRSGISANNSPKTSSSWKMSLSAPVGSGRTRLPVPMAPPEVAAKNGWISIPESRGNDSVLEREIAELDRLDRLQRIKRQENDNAVSERVRMERSFLVDSVPHANMPPDRMKASGQLLVPGAGLKGNMM